MSSAPVQPHQRIQYLDVIRGVAITGVLLAYAFWNLGTAPESGWTHFDKGLDEVFGFLVDSKCFTLLANLFTVGFVLHMNKTDDPARSLYTYRRRLAGLMIIGLIHALLLRNGDILLPYALLTFFVSFFYKASNKKIIIAMVITFLVEVLIWDLWTWLRLPLFHRPTFQGNYLVENFEWLKYWYSTIPFYWETTLFFLFSGLLLGKIFIQDKIKLNNRQLIIIAVSSFIVGAVSYYFVSFKAARIGSLPDIGKTFIVRQTVYTLLGLLHRAGLAASYASLFYMLSQRFSFRVFATLGRTSLTNYIMQAAIIVPLCLVLDLFDHVTPTIALTMTVSIWIFQVLFSSWWLKQHRFGPLEGLLRRFTYGKAVTATSNEEQTKTNIVLENGGLTTSFLPVKSNE